MKIVQSLINRIFRDIYLREIVSCGSTVLFIKIFGMLISYISMIYITNYYGAEDFGALTLIISIVFVASIIPKFGMESALVRIIGEVKMTHGRSAIKKIIIKSFLFVLALSSFVSISLYLSSEAISSDILNKDKVNYIELVAIAITPMVIISIIAALFQSLKKMKLYSFLKMTLVHLIFFLTLLVNDFYDLRFDIEDIYVYSIGLSLIVAIFFIYRLDLNLDFIKGNNNLSQPYGLYKILKTAFPMLLASLSFVIMNLTDVLMLGLYTTLTDVGIYSAAQKIATISSVLLIAINSIAAPKIIELYANKDYKSLESLIKQITRLMFYISAPFLLIFIFFPHSVMSIFGEGFTLGVTVLVLMSLSQCVNAISGPVGVILTMTDKQVAFQYVIIISTVLNIILNYILIPRYGIDGAAFATMVSMIFWNLTLVVYIKKKMGFVTIYIPKINYEKKI